MFFRYGESARFPNLLRVQKRKAHKQTVRSSLCAANPDLVLTTPTEEAAPILHSHKAEPGTKNDKHGSSLLSINESSLLLSYSSSKSPFTQGCSPPPAWNFLTETAMKYMPKDGNSFPSRMAAASDRVFPLSLAVSIQQFQTQRRADALSSRVFLPRSL